MSTRFLITSGLLVTLAAVAGSAAATRPDDPPRDERILKQFAEEFVPLTPGKGKFPASFKMGSAADGAKELKPVVEVTFKAPFAVAKYEVTQELYELLMGKNPSKWKGPRNSVEMVSWDEATEFCKKATDELRKRKLIADNEVIRLPSEAEWEYACRAGTTTAYSFGDKGEDLGEYAWFTGNAKGNDPPVGKKKPNAWGLYDMHGYVWEWTADAWADNHQGASPEGKPRQGEAKSPRLVRGGAWTSTAEKCQSAWREKRAADFRGDDVGFRCVKAAQ